MRRLLTATAIAIAVLFAAASPANAEPAGNAEVIQFEVQGAGSAQVDGTAEDGGLIDVTATATGGDPDFLGGLLGGLLPDLFPSGPAIATGTGNVSIIEDLEPGTYQATVTIDDARGTEQAEGDASTTAEANAAVLPTGAEPSEQGDPTLGRDSADLSAQPSNLVLEFEFEVAVGGSYTLGVGLTGSAGADGAGSEAVTTVSSAAVDAEITAVG